MTKGAVNGVPSLIDFDRNQFAAFPPGHELVFSDGHQRGIYPWEYLRALGGTHL